MSEMTVVMTDQHRLFLLCLGRGKAYAIKSRDLIVKYNSRTMERISDRTLRSLKQELNVFHGQYICSCDTGYFIANTPEEIADVEKYLYSWIKNLSHEVKAIKDNYARATRNTQGSLF